VDLVRIEPLIGEEYAYLLQEREGWSLTTGPQDLELVAHALRVLLHTGAARNFLDEYLSLVDCQNPDGGWSPYSADRESTVWVSAFCALMLVRGNRILKHDGVDAAVRRAVDYFLGVQEADGRWVDPQWADLDTTSHPVSFFNVVQALGHGYRRQDVRRSWRRGLAFILENEEPGGGWRDPDFHPSGVEMTAHLIQDSLVADLVMEGVVSGVREACARGLAKLREWQSPQGWWDEENVDHTMDSVRSSMVVSRVLGENVSAAAIERGLAWIVKVNNARGWPDFPGMETNLERTCDGLDTLLKYKAYRCGKPADVIRLWGYVP
jgi:hypothetical protein